MTTDAVDAEHEVVPSHHDFVEIAERFAIEAPIAVAPFPQKGNINLHTYRVVANEREYLLQKLNSDVFAMPHRVMAAMIASIDAQAAALAAGEGPSSWTPIELVPTLDGRMYLDLDGEAWRLMVFIPDSVSHKSLADVGDRPAQLRLAEEIGRGMAIYSDLTSSIDPKTIEGSLPGYRDTALYFSQFHSVAAGHRAIEEVQEVLPQDSFVRASTQRHFLVALDEPEYQARMNDPELQPYLKFVRDREPLALGLWTALHEGRIRHTLIHGDTKIENFLFDAQTGRVKALVDLDTIMPFTWLADWGDLLRSMVNVAGEKERDLTKIQVDLEVYAAVIRGFLNAAKEVTDAEVALMVTAVEAISLELGVRFLADYLRGDTYFQLAPGDPADLNKVRAMVQLELCRRLEEVAEQAEEIVAHYRAGLR